MRVTAAGGIGGSGGCMGGIGGTGVGLGGGAGGLGTGVGHGGDGGKAVLGIEWSSTGVKHIQGCATAPRASGSDLEFPVRARKGQQF
jgi:hypothetical protein